MKQEHESLKEETRGKHVERINTLSAQLDQQIEDLQRSFEAAHLSYLHETDSNTEEFKNLTSLDKAAARSIEVKLRLINKTQRAVDEWKAKLAATDREYSDKNSELEKEKGSMAQHTKRLKSRMAQISKFSVCTRCVLLAAAAHLHRCCRGCCSGYCCCCGCCCC